MMGKASGMLSFWDKKINNEPTNFSCATIMDEIAQNSIQLKRQTWKSWLVITVTLGLVFLEVL